MSFFKSKKFQVSSLVFYMLLLMAYAAFSLAFSILSYTETMKFSLNFAGIQNNWSSDVINAVSIVSSPSNCSNGTQPLFSWTWPGTQTGCNCMNSTYPIEKQLIYTGQCSKDQNSSNCQQIPSINPMVFSEWKEEFTVCVGRIQDYNFAAHHLKNSPSCPSGHVPCGQSLDYIFCVLNSTDCPITSMVVSDENPDPVLYLQYEQFFGRYQLWYSRVVDKTPIVQGKISQNNPCFDYSVTNTDEYEVDYVLLNTRRQYCTEDMRWVPLNTITEADFYTANGAANLTTILPNYTISDFVNERLWSQYIRNVIPMKFDFICRSAIEKLVVSNAVYSTEIDTQLINMIVACVVFFIFAMLYPYFQIALLFEKNLLLKKITDDVILQIRQEQKNTIARAIKLIQFPFVLVAMIISFSDMKIFQEIYDSQCSDPITNVQFHESAENIRTKTYYYNLSNFIFLCVLIGLDALMMTAMAISERRSKNKSDKEDYLQVKNQAEDKALKTEEKEKEKEIEIEMEKKEETNKKDNLEVEGETKKEAVRSQSFEFPDEEIDEKPTKKDD